MKKAIWKGTFCILVALLFILPANAGWIEKIRGTRGNNELLQMNSPVPIEKKWSRTFGRFLPLEMGESVEQTNDGGYIVLASTPYTWLIKVGAFGIKRWSRKFDLGIPCSVQQTNDRGYIITGDGIFLLKTNKYGREEWRKTYRSGWMRGDHTVQQTSDGGYIITGVTVHGVAGSDDVWLIKTDSNGNVEWDRKFGGKDPDGGCSVYQTNDGGYIIGGYTISYGEPRPNGNGWVIKADKNGIEEWNITFSSEDYYASYEASSIQQTKDGGYIIGSGRIIKIDSNGSKEWEKEIGCCSIQQTNDEGYIATGGIGGGSPAKTDLRLVKLDASGNLEWERIFGRDGYFEGGSCVRQTNDGGYIVTGTKQLLPYGIMAPLFLDVWLIKTDKMGKAMDLSKPHGIVR